MGKGKATDDLMAMLKAEKLAFVKKLESGKKVKKTRCILCPCRSFGRASRALAHVKKHHVAKKRYAPAGTKQLRVAQAIYDNDRITGEVKGRYLARSATFIRDNVGKSLGTSTTSVSRWEKDRKLSLLIDTNGPRYVMDKDIGAKVQARRQDDGTALSRPAVVSIFQSVLLTECRVERVMTGMAAQSRASGSEVTSMLPQNPHKFWQVS